MFLQKVLLMAREGFLYMLIFCEKLVSSLQTVWKLYENQAFLDGNGLPNGQVNGHSHPRISPQWSAPYFPQKILSQAG